MILTTTRESAKMMVMLVRSDNDDLNLITLTHLTLTIMGVIPGFVAITRRLVR